MSEIVGSAELDNKTCNFKVLLNSDNKDAVLDMGDVICY
jgi:hypothetical protein